MTDPKIREELKYAHRGQRDTPARRANREALAAHIAAIEPDPVPVTSGSVLHLAPRYRR